MEAQQTTPFSPCSFDFFPGSPDYEGQNNNSEMKSFRFAGAPDGPLPSIPSGDDEDSEHDSEPEITVRKRFVPPKIRQEPKTIKDFPWFCCLASICTFIGGIIFATASHKVKLTLDLYVDSRNKVA